MLLLDISLSVRDYVIIISINGVVTFLISEWFKNKIKSGFDQKLEDYKAEVKSELDRKLEDYKFSIRTREQAVKIAELFSEVYSPKELKELNKKQLNKLIWELSLWLPEELLKDLSQNLVNPTEGRDVKEILMDVRQTLLNTPPKDLKAENIIHFK